MAAWMAYNGCSFQTKKQTKLIVASLIWPASPKSS